MTKYEWDRQLKKGISSLPAGEQRRVLEYYNELFSDKIDAGMKEQEVIAEFGNPYDVANKLIVDYYNEDKGGVHADEYVYSDTAPIDETVGEAVPKRSAAESSKRIHVEVTKNTKSIGGLVVLICTLLFFVFGACFNKWHPAWMLFLCIPLVTTLVEAIEKRNWRIFSYPVFVVILYLLLGFYAHLWHPMWILFVTIPLYYVLGNYVSKSTSEKQDVAEECSEKRKRESEVETSQPQTKKSKSNGGSVGRTIAGIILAIALVFVMITIWWVVVALFFAGVTMIGGGIAAMIWAFIGMAEAFEASMIVLGGSLVVLGLGFVFTFGMVGLFRYCTSISKSFAKTISDCFNAKE